MANPPEYRSPYGYVYALHGRDGIIRYIGQTTMPLASRLGAHWYNAKGGQKAAPVQEWMRRKSRDAVSIVALEACWDRETLLAREAHWIATVPNLLNVEPGGELKGSLRPAGTGSLHSRAKLSEADIPVIRSSDESTKELGRRYGVSPATISSIRRGRIWKHVQ